MSAAKPVVIRMSADLHAAVKAKAAAEERSMAQAIRYALRLYVEDAVLNVAPSAVQVETPQSPTPPT